jgi:predicted TIM-barrel fold metal-dependent hydrolase
MQLAQDINNELKKAVDVHPDRFRALAELPLHQPEEGIKELRRCVKMGFVGALVSGSID